MRWAHILLGAALVMLGGCHRASQSTPAATTAAADKAEAATDDVSGVTLEPEQVQALGVETIDAAATTFATQSVGYGVVMSHEALAQAAAEVATAQAAARQSRAALARIEGLADTAGALPAETQETAVRQASADAAALSLAQRRLGTVVGTKPAWPASSDIPNDVANGAAKLIRVTFPLGALSGNAPRTLRLAPLDPASKQSWTTTAVWDAPADATLPGRSYFALLRTDAIGEGERLQAWAPTAAQQSGVIIPARAVVISDGRYWCYVERMPGHFERVEVDASKPTDDGYFATTGVMPGDAIVVNGAGLLLAREINPATEAE